MLKWAVNGSKHSNNNLADPRDLHCNLQPSKEASLRFEIITNTGTKIPTKAQNQKSKKQQHLQHQKSLQKTPLNSLETGNSLVRETEKYKFTHLPAHEKTNYASTLPSYDEEYSPCGIIPGPILALRGMGLIDNYFEKPRYLSANNFDTEDLLSLNKMNATPCNKEAKDLFDSLKSDDDCMMDRMINTILENNENSGKGAILQVTPIHKESNELLPDYWDLNEDDSQMHLLAPKTMEEAHFLSPSFDNNLQLQRRVEVVDNKLFCLKYPTKNNQFLCSSLGQEAFLKNTTACADCVNNNNALNDHHQHQHQHHLNTCRWTQILNSCVPKRILKKHIRTTKRRLSFSL